MCWTLTTLRTPRTVRLVQQEMSLDKRLHLQALYVEHRREGELQHSLMHQTMIICDSFALLFLFLFFALQ